MHILSELHAHASKPAHNRKHREVTLQVRILVAAVFLVYVALPIFGSSAE